MGDVVRLELGIAPRLTEPHPKIDAVRGCVAIEYGPVVYCLESADQPGLDLDEIAVDVSAPVEAVWSDVLGGVMKVTASGRPLMGGKGDESIPLTAVPYGAWANREAGAMRVWVPAGRAGLAS